MIQTYSENCDYLRNRFGLDNNTSIYAMIEKATQFIKEQDFIKEELEKESLEEDKNKTISKEKIKNVRRKKSS